jgi:hypothetical protein
MLWLDGKLPKGNEKQKRDHPKDEEEILPREIVEAYWDENRD